VIEKRRRDRINSSLTELRRLVPAAFEKQASVYIVFSIQFSEFITNDVMKSYSTVLYIVQVHLKKEPKSYFKFSNMDFIILLTLNAQLV